MSNEIVRYHDARRFGPNVLERGGLSHSIVNAEDCEFSAGMRISEVVLLDNPVMSSLRLALPIDSSALWAAVN